MAPPFDMSWTPELENKLSTQIDGQLPDFIAEDHPQFSQFLKSYYQFLESAELQLTVSIDNIILEVQTPTNLLNEDGTLIVTESGTGSTGKFVDSETITGSTSYATAKVLVEDLGNATPRLFISSQQVEPLVQVGLSQNIVQTLFKIFNNCWRMLILIIQFMTLLKSFANPLWLEFLLILQMELIREI